MKYRFVCCCCFFSPKSPAAADMKTTKLHVEKVHVQIEKRKNDACVVKTHVDLKSIEWAGLQSPTEV